MVEMLCSHPRFLSDEVFTGYGKYYNFAPYSYQLGFLQLTVAVGIGIKELKTPYQAPKANAFCEQFMGSKTRMSGSHFDLKPATMQTNRKGIRRQLQSCQTSSGHQPACSRPR